MNIIKTRFHNKMEVDILMDSMILYINIEDDFLTHTDFTLWNRNCCDI